MQGFNRLFQCLGPLLKRKIFFVSPLTLLLIFYSFPANHVHEYRSFLASKKEYSKFRIWFEARNLVYCECKLRIIGRKLFLPQSASCLTAEEKASSLPFSIHRVYYSVVSRKKNSKFIICARRLPSYYVFSNKG